MGWLTSGRKDYSRMLEKAREREQREKEFEELPTMGRTATTEDKQLAEITRLEDENAKTLETENKQKEKEKQTALEQLLVIDGARLECSLCTNPKGILKVNFDTPTTQEKKTATIEEKSSSSLIFTGNCKKSPNCSVPCIAAMSLGEWKNTGTMKIQDRPPLLLKSTIPCLYGGVDIKITDSGQVNEPEVNTEGAPVPAPKKKKITIKARQDKYTVVLKKDGSLFSTSYPNLEFEISNGTPGELIDIQVAKADPGLLTNTVGIATSWNKNNLPKDRVPVKTFSSFTHGDTTLVLNASGKATYTMPLEWWQDLARQPLSEFTTLKIYFKVLSFKEASTVKEESLVKSVEISNNLLDFQLNDLGYVGSAKNISMEFTVKEPGTTEMYTFVQWMQGSFKMWDRRTRVMSYASPHTLYGIQHIANFPEKTIDRLGMNPRYWDGNYTISNGNKTATATDAPGGGIPSNSSHLYISIDFETRLHLNYDVPQTVTIIKQEGSPPIYGVITGVLSDPQPLILTTSFWNTRVLQARDASGAITITTDVPFTGP